MRNLVSFERGSEGQVAIVIYEWSDASYLGKETSKTDDTLPVCVVFHILNFADILTENICLHHRGFGSRSM